MNRKRSFQEQWNFQNNRTEVSPFWVQAFLNGEGTFYFYLGERIRENGRITKIASPTLEICQNTFDIKVLTLLPSGSPHFVNGSKDFFEQGYLKPKFDINSIEQAKSVRSVSRYILTHSDKVIDFVDRFPMFTSKQEDYLKWKSLFPQRRWKGAHLNLKMPI